MQHVVFDMFSMLVVGEVPLHLHLHQEEPEGGGAQLDEPRDDPEHSSNHENDVPEPQQSKHLTRNIIE